MLCSRRGGSSEAGRDATYFEKLLDRSALRSGSRQSGLDNVHHLYRLIAKLFLISIDDRTDF